MTRDWRRIRRIVVAIHNDHQVHDFSDVPEDHLLYQLRLLRDMNWIRSSNNISLDPGSPVLRGDGSLEPDLFSSLELTATGQDFFDLAKSDEIWRTVIEEVERQKGMPEQALWTLLRETFFTANSREI